MPYNLVPGKNPPGCLYTLLTWQRERDHFSGVYSFKALIPFMKAPPPELIASKDPTITLAVMASTYEFEETQIFTPRQNPGTTCTLS